MMIGSAIPSSQRAERQAWRHQRNHQARLRQGAGL